MRIRNHILDRSSVERAGVPPVQVKETLSDDILAKIHAAPKDPEVPVIDPSQLPDFDGYIFGFPTRYDHTDLQRC